MVPVAIWPLRTARRFSSNVCRCIASQSSVAIQNTRTAGGARSAAARGGALSGGAPRDRDGNRQSVDSTIISVLPSGSRNQNIGGTGSPMRATCSSTSIPIDFM